MEVEPQLETLLGVLATGSQAPSKYDFDQMLRAHPRPEGGLYSKRALLQAFDELVRRGQKLACSREHFAQVLRIAPTRTHSGVTPVTVFTKPHPCPGTCIFCPSDVRMPKSYTLEERGSREGARHRFDPYLQTMARLDAYRASGQPCDKIELLILGGTWSSYPIAYQRWFVRRCFDALNAFGFDEASAEPQPAAAVAPAAVTPAAVTPAAVRGRYNLLVRTQAHGAANPSTTGEDLDWQALERAHRDNEHAHARCVGLVLETRPDHLDQDELRSLRRLGATKIQLGVQSVRDEILRLNRRGHDRAATEEAIASLRQMGFKVLVHWMPNLLGSSVQEDIAEYETLFVDPALRPDELKVYPCTLDPSAELMRAYREGHWRSYSAAELDRIVVSALTKTPRYCRIARIMRDLPGVEHATGGARASRRHDLEQRLRSQGAVLCDIRARELGAKAPTGELRLQQTAYDVVGGRECFLEWVDGEDRVAGFARLFLPDSTRVPACPELERSALLRELHVYGRATGLGTVDAQSAQHRGLGRALIEEAARRSTIAGFDRLSVISAVGTRPYYRDRGFTDGALYQHRPLACQQASDCG